MTHTKFCCDGQNAVMVTTLFPMSRIRNERQVKFYTAIYKCNQCHEMTLRGETNQLKAWSTFVEYINEDKARELIKERDLYVAERTVQ